MIHEFIDKNNCDFWRFPIRTYLAVFPKVLFINIRQYKSYIRRKTAVLSLDEKIYK